MRLWRLTLLVALLASVIVPTLPQLVDLMRHARELHPLPMKRRREVVLGDFYRGIEELQRNVPSSEPLAFIRTDPASHDAVFINYYLYPHPTRLYGDRWAYAFADPKSRPKFILWSENGIPRLATYAAIRDRELRRSRVVRDFVLLPVTRTSFAIPIVSSADGPPRDAYTIEGALASEGEAHVTLTLQPSGLVKELTIDGTRSFYDLVYECFGVMEFAAWVSVTSDRPIQAAFWFVNRRPGTAAPIRLVHGPLDAPASFPVTPTARLWLLNFGDRHVVAHAGAHDALVPPRTLMAVNATGTVSGPVYAFLSEREPSGQTRFVWPEDLR